MAATMRRRVLSDWSLIVGGLTASLLGLALPIGVIALFDTVIATGSHATLYALCLGMLVAIGLETVARIAMVDILSRKAVAFERDANEALIAGIFSHGVKEEAGAHIERAESVARLRDVHFGDAATTVLDAPGAAIFLVFLTLMSPMIGAAVALMGVLALGLSRLHRAGLEELQADGAERASRRYSFIIETISNIETVRAMNLEGFMTRRYERLVRGAAAFQAEEAARVQRAQGAAGAVANAAPLVVACIGAAEVIANQLSAGAFAASILLAGRVLQPILKLDAAMIARADARRRERALGTLAVATNALTPAFAAPPSIVSLGMENVTVDDARGIPLLQDVTFSVARGECVCVRGPTGSGKSLLLELLMAWTTPTEGRLLLNGAPADAHDEDGLRARVSYLPTRPRLITGTVLDNMTRFQPDLHADAALGVAAELGIDRFFAQHPVGLSLPCGGGAALGLPRSVEQRVPLVGALAVEPDVILFDEANSALDYEGDRLLLKALRRRRSRTAMVLITQQPDYRSLCDRAYVIADGRLVEEATSDAVANGRTLESVA